MIDIYSHAGNPATIKDVYKTNTRNGATLYHFTLQFEDSSKVKAVAYIDPQLNEKMKKLSQVYEQFKPGDKVHANLYQSGNFTDVYRLQKPKRKAKRAKKPRPIQMVRSQQNQEVKDFIPETTTEVSF